MGSFRRPGRQVFGIAGAAAVMGLSAATAASVGLPTLGLSGFPTTDVLLGAPADTIGAEAAADVAAPAQPPVTVPQETLDAAVEAARASSVLGPKTREGADRALPAPALLAYRQASAVMAKADPGCGVDWQLIAAIGAVESGHGQTGGATLGRNGVATPTILGPRLDGSAGTVRVADTDGGLEDADKKFDRAVGPMQFIPTTWADVAVDGDGDGVRDPNDIDDAALAAGVYLCAGDADLSTEAGRRSAVFRYNHSNAYVRLVLAVRENYLAGEYEEIPTVEDGTLPAIVRPDGSTTPVRVPVRTVPGKGPDGPGHHGPGGRDLDATDAPGHQPGSSPTPGAVPEPPQPPDVVATPGAVPAQEVDPDIPRGPGASEDATDAPTTEPTTDPTTDPTTEPETAPDPAEFVAVAPSVAATEYAQQVLVPAYESAVAAGADVTDPVALTAAVAAEVTAMAESGVEGAEPAASDDAEISALVREIAVAAGHPYP